MQAGAGRIMPNRQMLEAYPLFKEDPVLSITPVFRQGHCNENHVVKTAKRRYILRKLLRDDIDREREAAIHHAAYGKGLTAKLLFYDKEAGMMLFEYLEGKHKKELEKEEIVTLAQRIRILHRIPLSDLFGKPVETEALFPTSFTGDISALLHRVRQYERSDVLCHNDLNPYNLIWQDGGDVKMIDFEYAGMADRYFDLAAVSVEFSLTQEEERVFLESYFSGKHFLTEKLQDYKRLYHAVCHAWFADLEKRP